MFTYLQIPNPRERALVGLVDMATRPLAWGRHRPAGPPKRVLLLRLERIGDLLMTLGAIGRVRLLAPAARIDLAVGSWNADLAELVPGIDRLHVLDVPWLAREGRGHSWPGLITRARAWQATEYDLVINFEPDLRSNFLAWLSGAPSRVGYDSGGGKAFLTSSAPYDPSAHVGVNADRLVRRAIPSAQAGDSPAPAVRLRIPDVARREAASLLGAALHPLIGVHVSGGRPSKQWHPARFAEVARTLARRHGATIVLTGSAMDRPLVDTMAGHLDGVQVIDLCGRAPLPTLAAVLDQLDLLITGDTGPMHLGSAVGTSVVALFGPSDPKRYGPTGGPHEILRIDLPCSPCGLVRLPPVRCRNRVPECLDGIGVDVVVQAAERLLPPETAPGRGNSFTV